MKLNDIEKYGTWTGAKIRQWLTTTRVPLRVSCTTDKGPLIVPIWFQYSDGHIWCCSPQDSVLVKALQKHGEVAFDISTNEVPYQGVRGRGLVTCLPAENAETLETLLEKYLGSMDNQLSKWLLSRVDNEAVLQLEVSWLTSWDFSPRMGDIKPIG
jgi:nitroimidazol reductase NimA-like FMN-containing flavoprotein (pyridoxamine 5'-phosphate oxidase superfamily)